LPQAAVFNYLADARNQPAWCSGVASCRQIHLDRPALHARYQIHRKLTAWPRAAASLELVMVKPHHRLQWVRREQRITATVDCYVDKLIDETLVSYQERFDGIEEAPFAGLWLLVRRYQLPRELWRLKRLLEEGQGR
jgi:hypothetical protein